MAVYGASSSSSFLLLAGPRHFFPASPHFHSSTLFVFYYWATGFLGFILFYFNFNF